MRLRSAILLGVITLIVAVVVAAVGSVALVLERSARRDLLSDLERGRRVFEDLQAYRLSLFQAESRVVAEEPRLKAVVATQDINHETVLGVALDLKKSVQSDLFLLTDEKGLLVADVADPSAVGFDMGRNSVIRPALDAGEASGIWVHEAHAFQVQARRLSFGTTPVGVLAIGYEVDDRVAETVYRQTGDSIAVTLDGKLIAASPLADLADGDAPDRAALAEALRGLPASGAGELTIAGGRFLASSAPFPGYRGGGALRYHILRSLDRALEPLRRAVVSLVAVAAVSLLLAVLLAALLSHRLSRPVDALVAFTRRIADGNLEQRAALEGPLELAALAASMNRMVEELFDSRQQLTIKERLHKELEIATRIQTSLLPRAPAVEGLSIAARMIPAEEVGGDYYDVLPHPGGAFIGVGDVAGHGLTAGLVMLMIQSVVSALARRLPEASPTELVAVLNAVLFDNIRNRLGQDEHVTFTLYRYDAAAGTLVFSGAHEDLVICRAADGRCERIQTPGTWLGAAPDIRRFLVDTKVTLHGGDLVVLYSDGLVQAMDGAGEQFGMDRLCDALSRHRALPVEAVLGELLEALARHTVEHRPDDDVTLMVLRYQAPVAAEAADAGPPRAP